MQIGQRTTVMWDVEMAGTFLGTVISADKAGVVVEFDGEPGAGIDRRQRFTKRKDGRFIAARWHWAVGVPVLVAVPK
jgi:hypothetical protein